MFQVAPPGVGVAPGAPSTADPTVVGLLTSLCSRLLTASMKGGRAVRVRAERGRDRHARQEAADTCDRAGSPLRRGYRRLGRGQCAAGRHGPAAGHRRLARGPFPGPGAARSGGRRTAGGGGFLRAVGRCAAGGVGGAPPARRGKSRRGSAFPALSGQFPGDKGRGGESGKAGGRAERRAVRRFPPARAADSRLRSARARPARRGLR
ncbi:hypothetical protein GZL_02907 [Streptomyces sp. 769]|nr:hypothetical protein GZL_02907 [Streptomyces sp. 769]